MEKIVWDEAVHGTGHPLLDKEHHAIVEMYNKVIERYHQDIYDRKLYLVDLLAILNRMGSHFSVEEGMLMEYPDLLELEREEHGNISDQLTRFIATPSADQIDPLLEYVSGWLSDHLPKEAEEFRVLFQQQAIERQEKRRVA